MNKMNLIIEDLNKNLTDKDNILTLTNNKIDVL